jgi:hypothetical protein
MGRSGTFHFVFRKSFLDLCMCIGEKEETDFLVFLRSFAKKKRLSFASYVSLSVRVEKLTSYWTNFRVTLFEYFPKNLSTVLKFNYNLTRIAGALHEVLCKFVTVSLSVRLKTRPKPLEFFV